MKSSRGTNTAVSHSTLAGESLWKNQERPGTRSILCYFVFEQGCNLNPISARLVEGELCSHCSCQQDSAWCADLHACMTLHVPTCFSDDRRFHQMGTPLSPPQGSFWSDKLFRGPVTLVRNVLRIHLESRPIVLTSKLTAYLTSYPTLVHQGKGTEYPR